MSIEKFQLEKSVKKSKDIQRYIPIGSTLHEVGAGYEYLMKQLTEDGYHLTGNEVSEKCAEESKKRGMSVELGTLEEVGVEKNLQNLDGVLLYDLVEHLIDPKRELFLCKQILKEEGVLILRVPVLPPEGPKIQFVDHVWHFNEQTIAALLEQCGFTIVDAFNSGQYVGQLATVQGYTVVAKKIVEHSVSD